MDIQYEIDLFTDWHCGSGLAAGADVDALVVKDPDGFPYIPGKTIKGLLREAIEDIMDFKSSPDSQHDHVMKTFGFFDGKIDNDGKSIGMTRGTAHFSNAELSEAERKIILSDNLQPYLFRTVASTAIDSNGIAEKGCLRRMEVAVPCTLAGKITGVADEIEELLMEAMGYVKRLGQNRNRGLGRCAFRIKEKNDEKVTGTEDSKSKSVESTRLVIKDTSDGKKALKFKCTLLSDVILNRKAATTGPNETLDFIPGSNFLGIAASTLYSDKADPELTRLLFHSGKVRFGDAHPSVGNLRGLKVPASMFYPKLKKPEDELYIHHLINLKDEELRKKQLKQCREGFYDFSALTLSGEDKAKAVRIDTETNFAIKSAYDRTQRRSKDEQLFGYQSLRKGLTMYFSVEFDAEAFGLIEKVSEALSNVKRIGRSRTAEYGLVEITPFDYEEVKGDDSDGNLVTVYADSRLIFLDDHGITTFQPTAKQFGILGGEIEWEKSQIRTFRYAPWNYKRQCFDTDRCGIEKGSVFVVKIKEGSNPDLTARYLGSYQNEGFGRVIYNPLFLKAGEEGKALCRLVNAPVTDNDTANPESRGDKNGGNSNMEPSHLLDFIETRKEPAAAEKIYHFVNKCMENPPDFQGDSFASQWGQVRKIAQSAASLDALDTDLFGDYGYLEHGVAMEKWKENGRFDWFKNFVTEVTVDKEIPDRIARMAIVNLAAEMAKKCK